MSLPEWRRRVALAITAQRVRCGGADYSILRPLDWDALRVVEEECCRPTPHWARLWPSALALGDGLSKMALGDLRVLELGCGLGLPSLVAARAGARVLATDGSVDALAFVAETCARNNLEAQIGQVVWEEPKCLLAKAPWDVVVAADVLYERAAADALLDLLPRIVSPHGLAVIADPDGFGAHTIGEAIGRSFRVISRRDPRRAAIWLHTLVPAAG